MSDFWKEILAFTYINTIYTHIPVLNESNVARKSYRFPLRFRFRPRISHDCEFRPNLQVQL